VQLTAAGLGLALWGLQSLAHPPLVVALFAAGLSWVVLLVVTRNDLLVHETFPELASLPVVGRVLAPR
jgi:hypothetical protein